MRVMVFGTFDNLHPGHLHYFWSAWCFGAREAGKIIRGSKVKSNEIVAVIARDQNVLKIKGRLPLQNEKERATVVRQAFKTVGWPSQVVLGSLTDRWAVLKKYRPDFIALGYDQQVDIRQLKKVLASAGLFCVVKRLRSYHPELYKSSYFRRKE